MNGANIWSGAKGYIGALTNMTELAFRKGNLRNHYPVTFRGKLFVDAEQAYQVTKRASSFMNDDQLEALMVEVMVAKLHRYPLLKQKIEEYGGVAWLEVCQHSVVANMHWEGVGRQSRFIRCLIVAFEKG